MSDASTSVARPLPATLPDLIAQRKTPAAVVFNDLVEQIVLKLYENASFRALIAANYPDDAVEGSIALDDGEAARMIREYAREHPEYSMVAEKKLSVIVRAMHVVLRRYNAARDDRRRAI